MLTFISLICVLAHSHAFAFIAQHFVSHSKTFKYSEQVFNELINSVHFIFRFCFCGVDEKSGNISIWRGSLMRYDIHLKRDDDLAVQMFEFLPDDLLEHQQTTTTKLDISLSFFSAVASFHFIQIQFHQICCFDKRGVNCTVLTFFFKK